MPRKTIQTPLILPHDPHGPATFIHTVEQRLAKRPGVHHVKITVPRSSTATTNAIIELNYDPDLLSMSQIENCIQQAGGRVDPSIGRLVLPLRGMLTPQTQHTAQTMLNKLPGVTASVSFASQNLRLEFDRSRCALPEIIRQLDRLGLTVGPDRSGIEPRDQKTKPTLPEWLKIIASQPNFTLAIIGGLCLLIAGIVYLAGGPNWLRLTLLTVSYISCGWYLVPDTIKAVRQLHLDIDVLMLAAAFGAAWLGHLEEGALLLLLFNLGHAGQRLAMNRARRAIESLTQLAPPTATIIDPTGQHQDIPVEQLKIDDHVLIRPGQRIPADGRILEGHSAIDQSVMTGESIPVDKTIHDDVLAGTINGEGLLTIRVTKLASQSTLSRIIQLVEDAQTTKSPTQLFTDRVEKIYVPSVLLITLGLIIIPPMLAIEPTRELSLWSGWFYQAMAFLTAASPCALAIGTPAAVLSGIGRAARAGVLIKGGVHLENLGLIRVIAFDKTGTLTTGRPQITDVISCAPEIDESRLLALAAAIERGSDHPLARTIVAEAGARELPDLTATQIQQQPGIGIRGQVNHRQIYIGRQTTVKPQRSTSPSSPSSPTQTENVIASLEAQGKTVMTVSIDGQTVGVIAAADQPRPSAMNAISQLKQLGIRRTIMLTGDNVRTAQAVTQTVGIDETFAQLLPEDKLEKVRDLDQKFGRVAMVGDGVNDAPAMANATTGIAIGGAMGTGSGVALETADVALLANDLTPLPDVIGLSRFTRRVIIQNLAIALGVIAILAPLAALGQTTIYASVMFHEGSTILVVLNALRILAYRSDSTKARTSEPH